MKVEKVVIDGKKIMKFMKKARHNSTSKLICKLIAIKSLLAFNDVNLETLDKKTTDFVSRRFIDEKDDEND